MQKTNFHVSAMRWIAKYIDVIHMLLLFHSFVKSNFTYADIIWHFTSLESTIKMQRRALRIVYNKYNVSYVDLLNMASVPSLYVSRLKSIAIEAFKCIHKLNPSFLHPIVDVKDMHYFLRDRNRLTQPNSSTVMFGIKSFTYEASRIWNLLPPTLKNIHDLDAFKQRIKMWKGPQCMCQNCVLCTINRM